MSIEELYPSKSTHLKAEDLKGKAISVVISETDIAEFDNGNKLVLKFEDKEKGLVLNKTNAKMIASHYGDDESKWIGKKITVLPDKTSFQGSMVDCLRVRIEPELTEDDVPF